MCSMAGDARLLAAFQELVVLLTLDEGSPQSFKVRAYENAIHGIETAALDTKEMDAKQLIEIKGVGRSIANKIVEFHTTGRIEKLEDLRTTYPPGFIEITSIPGIGPKTALSLRSELGVESVEDLRTAIDSERLRDVPGLGKVSEEKIARSIQRLGLHGKDRRTPVGEALQVATRMVEELRSTDGVEDAVYCGSLRRFADTIGDVDILVASGDPGSAMEKVVASPDASEVVGHGDAKTSVLTRAGLQIDVRVVRPDQMGSASVYFTGSKAHNIELRQRAIDRGWLLNEYGLLDGDEVIASETEHDVYQALDMQWVPPPIRENGGEVELAASGELPELVQVSDIRGDLHYHSDRSGDGRASLEEMVEAAAKRGYEYIAMTEHGEDLTINGSDPKQMLAHRDRIRSLQETFPDVRILWGCELNIGRDGSLDYDQEFRNEFDWCVASVHSHFDLEQDEQTTRILKALSDPSIKVIGHLTGRKLGRRPGIDLDIDVILEALAVTGVGLEVNGAIDRLDASAEVVRSAIVAGVDLVISTDSHHPSELRRMDWGVLNAQRGWAEPGHVVNTLPRAEFLEWTQRRT